MAAIVTFVIIRLHFFTWWIFISLYTLVFIYKILVWPEHYVYNITITDDTVQLDYLSTPFFKRKSKQLLLTDIQAAEMKKRNLITGYPAAANFKYQQVWLTLYVVNKTMFTFISSRLNTIKQLQISLQAT